MALKSALNIGALSLILSLEAVAAGSFLIPAEALNSPANLVQHPSRPQLPLNWQTVQLPQPSGSRPNSQQLGAAWNSFQPPEDGVPGRREGGGTRGLECPTATTALTALIPQSTMGQTISAKPTFFYYLPVALDKTVQFELADQRDKTLYKKSFRMVTSRGGVVSVSLGSDDNSPALEVGKNYQWYFTIKCNPKNTQDDVLVSGWINRTAVAPSVKTELDRSPDLTKLSIFAQQSLWYEYLATLAQLRLQSPSDASLAIKWLEVLNSVELGKIAQEPLVASEITPITRK
ncbi:DUF928 domain-containing protein [Microcoleus sp. Pol12B5]|uniref:DUF928 domain-containing protein n=1 Tax=Microcoleus sp. Pol12B5 TaxID=3055396 RepID=UPI002FD76B45